MKDSPKLDSGKVNVQERTSLLLSKDITLKLIRGDISRLTKYFFTTSQWIKLLVIYIIV